MLIQKGKKGSDFQLVLNAINRYAQISDKHYCAHILIHIENKTEIVYNIINLNDTTTPLSKLKFLEHKMTMAES